MKRMDETLLIEETYKRQLHDPGNTANAGLQII